MTPPGTVPVTQQTPDPDYWVLPHSLRPTSYTSPQLPGDAHLPRLPPEVLLDADHSSPQSSRFSFELQEDNSVLYNPFRDTPDDVAPPPGIAVRALLLFYSDQPIRRPQGPRELPDHILPPQADWTFGTTDQLSEDTLPLWELLVIQAISGSDSPELASPGAYNHYNFFADAPGLNMLSVNDMDVVEVLLLLLHLPTLSPRHSVPFELLDPLLSLPPMALPPNTVSRPPQMPPSRASRTLLDRLDNASIFSTVKALRRVQPLVLLAPPVPPLPVTSPPQQLPTDLLLPTIVPLLPVQVPTIPELPELQPWPWQLPGDTNMLPIKEMSGPASSATLMNAPPPPLPAKIPLYSPPLPSMPAPSAPPVPNRRPLAPSIGARLQEQKLRAAREGTEGSSDSPEIADTHSAGGGLAGVLDVEVEVVRPPPPSHSNSHALLRNTTVASRRVRQTRTLPAPPLEVPTLPFLPGALTQLQYEQCGTQVHLLSTLWDWCKLLPIWFPGTAIDQLGLETALIQMYKAIGITPTGQLPEQVANAVVDLFFCQEAIGHSPTGPRGSLAFFSHARVLGVMVPLCRGFDYVVVPVTQRDLPLKPEEVEITRMTTPEGDQWYSFWAIPEDVVRLLPKSVVRFQCAVFEVVKLTYLTATQGEEFVEEVGALFLKQQPPLTSKPERFYDCCFKPIQELAVLIRTELWDPMARALREGMYFTTLFALLFPHFLRKAQKVYARYVELRVDVKDFLDHHTSSVVLDTASDNGGGVAQLLRFDLWYNSVGGRSVWLKHFTVMPLLHYCTQLATALEVALNALPSGEGERTVIERLMGALRKMGHDMNKLYGLRLGLRELMVLQRRLYWKNIPKTDLRLDHKGRLLLHEGNVFKLRVFGADSKLTLLLLDNFLLITELKPDMRLKVVEHPIPMEYLMVEIDEGGEAGSEAGATLLTVALDGSTVSTTTTNTAGTLTKRQPMRPLSLYGTLAPQEVGSIVYLFSVRYAAAHGALYTYYTKDRADRDKWRVEILAAKQAMFERTSKVALFKLVCLSDAQFQMPLLLPLTLAPHPPHNLTAPNDPVRLALHEVAGYRLDSVPRKLMELEVYCLCLIRHRGLEYVLVGLKYGVYMTDRRHPREWRRVLELTNVTQIGVMQAANMVFVLLDKQVLYYPKAGEVFAAAYSLTAAYNSTRYQINGTKMTQFKDVVFFDVGYYRDTHVLMLMRQLRNKSKLRILYPIIANGEFDAFSRAQLYKCEVHTTCMGILVFRNLFTLHTTKGFEIMLTDNPVPKLVPMLPPPVDAGLGAAATLFKTPTGVTVMLGLLSVERIRARFHQQPVKTKGMYKLANRLEFLLVYEDFAVFTDNRGWLARPQHIKFRFRCHKTAFRDNLLFLVCPEAVEIWLILNHGRANTLVQVITGKNIRLILGGSGGGSSSGEGHQGRREAIRVVMENPEVAKRQMVVELVPLRQPTKEETVANQY